MRRRLTRGEAELIAHWGGLTAARICLLRMYTSRMCEVLGSMSPFVGTDETRGQHDRSCPDTEFDSAYPLDINTL